MKTAVSYGIMYLGFIAMIGSIVYNLFVH